MTPLDRAESVSLMDDGITPFTPHVNCIHCGRFVGRDGSLSYEHAEMSTTVLSLDGECRRCIDRDAELVPLVKKVLETWQYDDRWLTALNIRNVIENSGGKHYRGDEIQRACWHSEIVPHIEKALRWGTTVYRWKAEARVPA